MVSRKNIKYKAQQDAKRVPHYGIRKLSIGVASVLLGTAFYLQNGTAYADVNPTVSAGNDSVNVVNKDSGTSGSTGATSTSIGVSSAGSSSSVLSVGDTTNSMFVRQSSGSPAEGAANQANNTAWAVSESGSAALTSQVNTSANKTNAVSSLSPVSNRQTNATGNSSDSQLSANLSLPVNQKLNVNLSSLLASKMALTGSNNAVNGGFDKATWGTLDVNDWKGSVQGNYYQLTDYTGDANHVIVPNEADFAKAGISTSGKPVGVTSDLMNDIFTDYSAGTNLTIAFSKTDNKMVKAINADWSNTWNAQVTIRGAKLSKFDGTNLDVSNVTNMTNMFYKNQINNLSPLANWKVDNVTNMNNMFSSNQISDLSPLANWNISNVKYMSWMFYNNQISDLSPLANWDVSNVTNMYYMFDRNQISDLSPLASWKVDHVTDMSHMFSSNQIDNLSPLANWDVSNVTNMNDMLSWNKITDLSPLANWKVDQVTDMNYMFGYNQIDNLSSLANWDVAKVTDMNCMFYNNRISDLSPLANWKVDNVTNMNTMFEYNQISDLSPLANWKTDNVTDMSYMFEYNQISDLSPLANWKVNNVTNMNSMFDANQIGNVSPLANWKVDQVTDMGSMFDYNQSTQMRNFPAKRVINFVYPDSYTGKKQGPVTQTVDVPQRVSVTLTTKDSKPSNNILDWVTKTETPATPAPVYFQAYTVPAIKGLLEPDQTVIAGQQADLTKPINVTVTYKLVESNTNDAFALDSKNGLHEHANVNDNGGYDTDFWGTLDVSKFTTVKNGDNLEITGYNGDASKVIIPNIADFEINNLDQGAKQVTISSQVMHQLAKNATRIGLSKTNNQKVVASDAIWSDAFGGITNEPGTYTSANGGIKYGSPNLTQMDLHNLDTAAITNMGSLFNGGNNLITVGDLSEWDTNNVTDMRAMFQKASSLTNIGNLDNWHTSKVTDMTEMFGYATNLTNIGDLSKWQTGNVTNMAFMFTNATNLTNIGNLDNWDTSKVTDMHYMFGTDPGKQSHLTNIGDLSKWQTGNVTDMNNMFANATDLTNIGNLDNWNTSNVSNMSWMFSVDSDKQSHLINIGDLSKWNTSKVTNMAGMFSGTTNLTNIGNLDNWDTSNVTNMARMFYNATNLTNIGDLSKWQTGNVTDMSFMFANAANLTNIGDLSKWNTSKVTDMRWMFGGTTNLTNIGNLDNWDTSKVTNMMDMFVNATNLTNIGDLSKWQTGNVTNMSYMFANATNLTNIGNLDDWNTSKVTDMGYMFYYASRLTNIGDLSKWQTGNVTNMMWMFVSTNALRYLNISNWDLTKLANKDSMKYMFANDTDLTIIANDLALPVWYQNEINDADYFWNHHIAVITNVPELIRATGDIDSLKIDNQDASRSIFYDSKGSSDAIQVLKDANQAYVKQYQSKHPGYTLNLAADVDQTDPIALANASFVSVPREVQFTIAYYDLTGKLVDSTTSTHKVGDTVSISLAVPNNYVLVSGQSSTDRLMYWGLNEADFLIEPKVTTTTQTKMVSRTIKLQAPDGQTNNVVQTVKFVRNGYLNQVTKQTTYSSWSFGGHYQFSGYQPKPVDGYTADVVPAVSVTPDSLDTTVNVAYHQISAVYSVDYQLANGTVVKNVSVTPEGDGTIHLAAPQGYRLLTSVTDVQVVHGSQKLAVLVAPAEQTYTAHSTLPSSVTEPLIKTVTRMVKITMPNGHVRTVKQSVKFERTVVVKADGTVVYSNWQAWGRAQFNKLFVPKRRGYHLVITDASGKALTAVEKIDHVTAAMNDEMVSVKYVKD